MLLVAVTWNFQSSLTSSPRYGCYQSSEVFRWAALSSPRGLILSLFARPSISLQSLHPHQQQNPLQRMAAAPASAPERHRWTSSAPSRGVMRGALSGD
jgi:hypothetical protein